MAEPSAHDILLVDASADVRNCLTLLLEQKGYSVATSADAGQALEFLRRHPSPRLVLLELEMEIPGGWQLLSSRCRDPVLSRVPFVALSTTGRPLRCAGLALGVDDFLEKPVGADELLAVVGRYCSRGVT